MSFSDELLRKIWEAEARNNLQFFMEYESGGRWIPAKHLQLLCDALEKIARREIFRLIVTMPPRHGKSELISKKFPAWYLGNYPDDEIILTSYAAELAVDFSKIARETFREWSHLWGLEISDDTSAAHRWKVKGHRGGLSAAGAGGPITGRGARVAIIDDPFKNYEEASSQTYRDKIWDWYRSTLLTRLTPDGAVIIVQTRWHEDDLVGRILEQVKAQDRLHEWTILELPALAEENDILGRNPGEPLWPERFDREWLLKMKEDIGSYLFSALYGQKPAPAEGQIVKRSWFRYFSIDGDYYVLHTPSGEKRFERNKCMIFQTCDPAATESEHSDYFVLSTWAVTQDHDLLLLDVFRERAETTKHKSIILSLFERWSPMFVGVENRTFGLNIIQDVKREGIPIKPLKADTDKVSRFRPMAARYEVGSVYHLKNAPWLLEYEKELLAFPKAKHDDQVDTASYAGLELSKLRHTPKVKAYVG